MTTIAFHLANNACTGPGNELLWMIITFNRSWFHCDLSYTVFANIDLIKQPVWVQECPYIERSATRDNIVQDAGQNHMLQSEKRGECVIDYG